MEDESKRILKQLGLTSQQAKVYLALCRIEKASANTLSQIAQIDRSEVYRAVSGLLRIGLIEKIIDVPTNYRSIPLTNSFSILLKQKKKEITQLESSISKLNIKKETRLSYIETKNEDFIFIPKTYPYLTKLREKILQAKHSIDILTTPSRDEKEIDFKKDTKILLKRGVKFRVLTDDPENSASFSKALLVHLDNPLFEFRKTNEIIAAPLGIRDGKEAFIYVSQTTDFYEAAALFVNNPRLIRIVQGYFESLWNCSQEITNMAVTQIKES